MVEQWTHKPLDVGSNPTLATIYLKYWMWVSLKGFATLTNPTLATIYLTGFITSRVNWLYAFVKDRHR